MGEARDAVVVGGGIGGLASAVALADAGWRVTVLERADELREVGAGLGLTRNALAALRALGLDDDEVAALGAATRPVGTWDLHGRPILRIPASVTDVELRGAHRGRLHTALLDQARRRDVDVVTGAKVAGVAPGAPDGERAVVTHGRGQVTADLVVGADGVRSAVRTALAPGVRPVYSGYSSWRAVIPTDAVQPSVGEGFLQFWGPHAEFGIVPVGSGQTYWYGYVRMAPDTHLDDELGAVRERFAGWVSPVQAVLDASSPEHVIRHDVWYLPGGIPRYTTGRVVMVGDAAHATVPTMGQGAASALEDGICVGRLIGGPVARGGDLAAALARFDAERRPRCRSIGRASVASGRFGAHLGPVWQAPRNLMMRLTPASVLARGASAVMGWTPPA